MELFTPNETGALPVTVTGSAAPSWKTVSGGRYQRMKGERWGLDQACPDGSAGVLTCFPSGLFVFPHSGQGAELLETRLGCSLACERQPKISSGGLFSPLFILPYNRLFSLL